MTNIYIGDGSGDGDDDVDGSFKMLYTKFVLCKLLCANWNFANCFLKMPIAVVNCICIYKGPGFPGAEVGAKDRYATTTNNNKAIYFFGLNRY